MSNPHLRMLAFACALIPACDQVGQVGSSESGAVGVKISLPRANDVALDAIDYTISGPNSYQKAGTVSLDKSLRSKIEGIPAERGYAIKLTTQSATHCTGSSSFDIGADSVTSVVVRMQCAGADKEQEIDTENQACPVVERAIATPAVDGKSFVLSGLAHVQDDRAGAPTYKWTVSRGRLSGSNATDVTLTCPADGGDIAMTFEVGAVNTTCSDKQALPSVNCRRGGV